MNCWHFMKKLSFVFLFILLLSCDSFADYQIKSDDIRVDTSGFSKNLGSTDSNVQHALSTIDQLGVKGDKGDQGIPGTNGQEVLLQKSDTHIQWKYSGDVSWTNLVALADLVGPAGTNGTNGTNGSNGTNGINGREIEIQNSGTYIQWRYVGDVSWTNIIALSALKGDKGDKGDTGAASTVPGPKGDTGDVGPNVLSSSTVTALVGILTGDGSHVGYITDNHLNWDSAYSAIHAAVTLDANAQNILTLTTQALGLHTQVKNKFFAGPLTGSDVVPTFRVIDPTDLPDMSGTYLPVAGTAADSSKLNGQSASFYYPASNPNSYTTLAAVAGVGYVTGTPWTGMGYLTSVAGAQLDNIWSSNGILVRTGAATYGLITDNHSNWDTAYGWGNHASVGYQVSGSPVSVTVPNSGNSIGLDITQNDTTNNPAAALITNTGTGNALRIVQTGTTSASVSTGGAVLLNNTGNIGAGLILYSNAGASNGRLMNIKADNSLFDQAALHIDYDGKANAVEIVHTSTQEDGVALTITEDNPNASVVGLSSNVKTHGVEKIIHTGTGDDTSASMWSADFQGVGTACQGLFMTSTVTGGGTLGKLLNLRNRVQAIGDVETELLTFTYAGYLGLSSPTPAAVLDIGYANKTGVTSEFPLFRSKSQTVTLDEGTTLANFRQNQFLAPTLNGVSGGGTETVTTAATVYIDNAPSGSNITLSNPYALYVAAGDSKFGGQVIGTTFRSTSGGIVNNSSANNARMQLNSTGNIIDRNIADSNPCLIVQQVHASSTGDILQVKNNAATLLTVAQNGLMTLGGNLALGANSITMTGSLGATGSRLTAGFFTDLAVTNAISANITGTASNLSGTPALPNGTTATTQSQADNSTKLATTAYVDSGLSGKQASGSYEPALGNPATDGLVLSSTAAGARSWIAAGGGSQTPWGSNINAAGYSLYGIPKIYPASDSTTAFGFYKANGTTNVLNIDTSNERVGIGTTTPAAKLVVSGSSTDPTYFLNTNVGIGTATPESKLVVAGSSTDPTYFLDTNVGIGTSTPASKFVVAGTSTADSYFLNTNIGIGTVDPLRAFEVNEASGNTMRLIHNDADGSPTNYVDLLVTSGGKFTITPSGGEIVTAATNISTDTTTGMKIGTGATEKLGFFGATPIVQCSAYTQTYSTAARTNPNATAATLTDNSGGTANTTLESIGSTYSQSAVRNNFADLAAMENKNTADVLALKKLLNAIIDDLQALGLAS